MILELATLAGALGALFVSLERYRKTSHGQNPWTVDGLMNVVRLQGHFERAAELIDGAITSVFRSEGVNKAAGGVPTSRHLRGLAVDIKPRMLTPREALTKLLAAAERGELGPVRTILEEPTVVHIEYLAADETAAPIKTGYWQKPGRNAVT